MSQIGMLMMYHAWQHKQNVYSSIILIPYMHCMGGLSNENYYKSEMIIVGPNHKEFMENLAFERSLVVYIMSVAM